MCKSLSSLFLFVFLGMVPGLIPIHAQERAGSVTGTITDASGGVLPGARAELTPTAQTFVSNGQGQFAVHDLAPGNYKLTASYIGFAPLLYQRHDCRGASLTRERSSSNRHSERGGNGTL